ncbi:MAG: phosphatase PAP2 family protein [Pseudonocardiaceae bacterium]
MKAKWEVSDLRSGAVLLLLLAVPLGVLVLLGSVFATVLDDVTENDDLAMLDAPVSGLVHYAREPWLSRFFEVVTWAGSAILLAPLMLLVGLYLRQVTSRWRSLTFLVVSLLGASVLSKLIKSAVARPRPFAVALVEADGYGFPSGHSTAAIAAWLALALALGAGTPRWGPKVALVSTALVIAGLVGLSRVYLGVHEPTDVLGGWSLGALWVVTVRLIDSEHLRRLIRGHVRFGKQSAPQRAPHGAGR